MTVEQKSKEKVKEDILLSKPLPLYLISILLVLMGFATFIYMAYLVWTDDDIRQARAGEPDFIGLGVDVELFTPSVSAESASYLQFMLNVESSSPAVEAGFRDNDLLLGVNDRVLDPSAGWGTGHEALQQAVEATPDGELLIVNLLRRGEKVELEISKEDFNYVFRLDPFDAQVDDAGMALLLVDIYFEASVEPESPAAVAGITRDDVILALNDIPVGTLAAASSPQQIFETFEASRTPFEELRVRIRHESGEEETYVFPMPKTAVFEIYIPPNISQVTGLSFRVQNTDYTPYYVVNPQNGGPSERPADKLQDGDRLLSVRGVPILPSLAQSDVEKIVEDRASIPVNSDEDFRMNVTVERNGQVLIRNFTKDSYLPWGLGFATNFGFIVPFLSVVISLALVRLGINIQTLHVTPARWTRVALFWLSIGTVLVGFRQFYVVGRGNTVVSNQTFQIGDGLIAAIPFALAVIPLVLALYWLDQNALAYFKGEETLTTAQTRFAWNMLIPTIAILILVAARPLEQTFVASFTDKRFGSAKPEQFIGFDNYERLLGIKFDVVECLPAQEEKSVFTLLYDPAPDIEAPPPSQLIYRGNEPMTLQYQEGPYIANQVAATNREDWIFHDRLTINRVDDVPLDLYGTYRLYGTTTDGFILGLQLAYPWALEFGGTLTLRSDTIIELSNEDTLSTVATYAVNFSQPFTVTMADGSARIIGTDQVFEFPDSTRLRLQGQIQEITLGDYYASTFPPPRYLPRNARLIFPEGYALDRAGNQVVEDGSEAIISNYDRIVYLDSTVYLTLVDDYTEGGIEIFGGEPYDLTEILDANRVEGITLSVGDSYVFRIANNNLSTTKEKIVTLILQSNDMLELGAGAALLTVTSNEKWTFENGATFTIRNYTEAVDIIGEALASELEFDTNDKNLIGTIELEAGDTLTLMDGTVLPFDGSEAILELQPGATFLLRWRDVLKSINGIETTPTTFVRDPSDNSDKQLNVTQVGRLVFSESLDNDGFNDVEAGSTELPIEITRGDTTFPLGVVLNDRQYPITRFKRSGLKVDTLNSKFDVEGCRRTPGGVEKIIWEASPSELDTANRYSEVTTFQLFDSNRGLKMLGRDAEFMQAVGNTLTFSVISVPLELLLGLLVAIIVNEQFAGRGLLRTAMLVPWAIPTVVSATLWLIILRSDASGIMNKIGEDFGLLDDKVAWLTPLGPWMSSIIMVDVWKTTPFMALILLAGLQTIPKDLYEAASVDGAGRIRQFFSITLPLLRPTIAVALVFRTLDALRAFDVFYVLLSESELSMASYNFVVLIGGSKEGGYAAAIGVLIFFIIMIFTILYMRFVGIGEERRS